jgi:hypothetical protein
VTVLARDGDETFEANTKMERMLLDAIAQCDRATRFRSRSCWASFAIASERAAPH